MLINSKMGKSMYLLDKEHLPLLPEFEDNVVVMDPSHPTFVHAQEKKEKAKAERAAKIPSAEEASQVFLKSKQDQLGYLIQVTLRIEKGLATLTQNQESLERIFETKMHDLDVKVTEIQSTVEKIQEELEDRDEGPTTDDFQQVPRGPRSSAVLVVTDPRHTMSAPAATASVAPLVATPPAPQTSSDAFVAGLLSTPPLHSGAPGDHA